MNFTSRWLSTLTYDEGLRAQKEAWSQVHESNLAQILGLEHRAVITMGKRSKSESDLLLSKEEIQKQNIDLHFVDRGGEATLHSPGQLVIYPIVPLSVWNLGVRDFICLLEKTTISFLKKLNVEVQHKGEEPGLYTKQGKIVFYGIRVDRGITRHGLSINVQNDLNLFKMIRSCGKDSEKFDKLENYSSRYSDLESLFKLWLEALQSNAQADICAT